MSNDEGIDIPSGRRAQLAQSISNLIAEFGQTDSVGFGLVVNLGLALLGVVVWWATTGIVSYAGAVWAILNLLGIVKLVLRL